MANLLTTASRIMCPHGGQATLITSNTKVTANGSPVLLETDVHLITGCSFTIGPKYSPCVRIEWSMGAMMATVDGTKPLTQSSTGRCIGAEGAPQGMAMVSQTQAKASAT